MKRVYIGMSTGEFAEVVGISRRAITKRITRNKKRGLPLHNGLDGVIRIEKSSLKNGAYIIYVHVLSFKE